MKNTSRFNKYETARGSGTGKGFDNGQGDPNGHTFVHFSATGTGTGAQAFVCESANGSYSSVLRDTKGIGNGHVSGVSYGAGQGKESTTNFPPVKKGKNSKKSWRVAMYWAMLMLIITALLAALPTDVIFNRLLDIFK